MRKLQHLFFILFVGVSAGMFLGCACSRCEIFQEVVCMWHKNLGRCELCGKRTEVWKLYSVESKRWYWVCKECWKNRQKEFASIDEIVDIAKIWGD